MTLFWSIFVTVVTIGTLLGSYWLLTTTRKSEVKDGAHLEKDHTFDGISELETPLPRWWYYLFLLTIAFSFVYLALFPGLGNFKGLLGWSSTGQWEREVAAAAERYNPLFERFLDTPLLALTEDRKAMRMGQRIFGNYCAQCHGSAAQGAHGFPNLRDHDWLWGNSEAQIQASIRQGRQAAMPSWAAPLGEDGVTAMAQYVRSLSGASHDAALAAEAAPKFAMFCVACHGPTGTGNVALGAPNLTDNIWLYGGSADEIAFTLRHGRNGQMPAHEGVLDDARIHLVAAYVLSLSQGAKAAATSTAAGQ